MGNAETSGVSPKTAHGNIQEDTNPARGNSQFLTANQQLQMVNSGNKIHEHSWQCSR